MREHKRCATSRIASSTGCTSLGEREITSSTSAVAVWYSSASVTSAVRAFTSVKSRAFSIAMIAWSAKVWISSTSAEVGACQLGQPRPITPQILPPLLIGTPIRW